MNPHCSDRSILEDYLQLLDFIPTEVKKEIRGMTAAKAIS